MSPWQGTSFKVAGIKLIPSESANFVKTISVNHNLSNLANNTNIAAVAKVDTVFSSPQVHKSKDSATQAKIDSVKQVTGADTTPVKTDGNPNAGGVEAKAERLEAKASKQMQS